MVTAGWTDRQIARRLGITVSTVRKHLSQVFDKAVVRGRAAVADSGQEPRKADALVAARVVDELGGFLVCRRALAARY